MEFLFPNLCKVCKDLEMKKIVLIAIILTKAILCKPCKELQTASAHIIFAGKRTFMRKNILTYSYDDAWRILCYDSYDSVVIDAASEEVMLRIEKAMSRLKVMGRDERRFFWIWANRNAREREWLKVVTAHVGDFHYLILSDGKYKDAVLKNAESINHNETEYRYDLLLPLLALEKHVLAIVDWICEAPTEYNAYVERYLPFHKRSGDIPRKKLRSILPGRYSNEERKQMLRGLESIKASAPSTYDTITLRTYITIWSAAYRVLAKLRFDRDDDPYDKERLVNAQTMTDEELFRRYNSKGDKIETLNLDSATDYEKWYDDNSPYHCIDVAYARIHLYPWEEIRERTYHFHLHFGVYGYYDDVAVIANALHEQGINLVVDEIDSIIKILREEDMVGFRPWPDKYMDRDGVTNQVLLPYIGEVSREAYWQIIKSTTWHKQKEVIPL